MSDGWTMHQWRAPDKNLPKNRQAVALKSLLLHNGLWMYQKPGTVCTSAAVKPTAQGVHRNQVSMIHLFTSTQSERRRRRKTGNRKFTLAACLWSGGAVRPEHTEASSLNAQGTWQGEQHLLTSPLLLIQTYWKTWGFHTNTYTTHFCLWHIIPSCI